MKVQWIGLSAVMLAASVIIGYKAQALPQAAAHAYWNDRGWNNEAA